MDFCYGSQCLKHFCWLCGHKEGIKSLKALAIPRYKKEFYECEKIEQRKEAGVICREFFFNEGKREGVIS